MDKWLNNPTAIKIMSLLLALFLFIQVGNSEFSKTAREFQLASLKEEVFIDNVPVEIYYDQENFVATDVPETCTVKLSGPKSLVMQAQAEEEFTVAIYLEDPQLGENTVTLEVENISENITAEVSPATAVISIQERVSEEYTVDYSVENLPLPEDYEVEDVVISPSSVMVSGGEEEIEKISTVKVVVNEDEEIDSSFEKELPIRAYDKDGNELEVTIDPPTAHVEVKIKAPSKEVGINPVIKGEVDPEHVLDSVELSQDTVIAYGTNEALDDLSAVDVVVDVSGLRTSKTISVELDKPSGIEGYSHPKIEVTINVSPKSEKTFKDILVTPLNLDAEKYEITFPEGDKVDVIAKGSDEGLASLTEADFQVTFDASDLEEGTYDVGLTVTGPKDVSCVTSKNTIKVTVTKK